MKDITTIEDVRLLVGAFYEKIRNNQTLSPVFNRVMKDHWHAHIEKMHRFWQTVLLSEQAFHGRPFPAHAHHTIQQKHFSNWLSIWHETIDSLFVGEKAEEAKWRGDRMAAIFFSRIEYHRNNPTRPLL